MTERFLKSVARLRGYRVATRLLSQTPYWHESKKQEYVLSHLRRTLIRAYEGTSFYRELFRQAGFDPRTDFRQPEDIAKLPLLTKDQVRANLDRMTDRRFQLGAIRYHTSGTTGEPLHMLLNNGYVAFDSACLFRHWSAAGYGFRDSMFALRSYVPENDTDPLWRYSRSQNTLFMSAYHLTPANFDQYLAKFLEFRPKYVKAYPSSINVFSEYAYPHRDELQFVNGIFTASETLLPNERENIERTFGRKLFNWYGMTEPVAVITECEAHEGMHVNWEYGYVEFLPSDDLPPDEYRIVATSFHNPAMPFIRYDTGDVARLYPSERACSCGRNQFLVETVVGRKDECIVTPDGRRLPSVNFYSVFRKYESILRFQIVQYGLRDVVFKIGLRDGADASKVIAQLQQELPTRVGEAANVTIEATDRFLTNSDGKTPIVVRKLGVRAVEEREEYAISSQIAWKLANESDAAVYKLDWNESDRVPAYEHVQRRISELLSSESFFCWYPDADSTILSRKIAKYAGVDEGSVVLTHGSDSGMEVLANAFVKENDEVVVVVPTYDNFRAVVEQRGARVESFHCDGRDGFPLANLTRFIQQHSPRIVYLTNPNNPIGYGVDRNALGSLAEFCQAKDAILVVDEAYYEFHGVTVADETARFSRLVVMRTFSKAFGLAGVRLGYLVASPQVVNVVKRIVNPKHVTMLAKAVAEVLLDHVDDVQRHVSDVTLGKERLYRFLDGAGVEYYPSQGNFVLIRHEAPDALIRHLQASRILVRDRTRLMNNVGHVRVTIGGLDSTDALLASLSAFFGDSAKT